VPPNRRSSGRTPKPLAKNPQLLDRQNARRTRALEARLPVSFFFWFLAFAYSAWEQRTQRRKEFRKKKHENTKRRKHEKGI
jgi:hypothetical protein